MTRIRKSYRVNANTDAMKRASNVSVISVDTTPVTTRPLRGSTKAKEAAAAAIVAGTSSGSGDAAEVAWTEESIDSVGDGRSDTSGTEPPPLHFCMFIVRFPKLAFGKTLIDFRWLTDYVFLKLQELN